MKTLKRFLKEESGQSTTEYILILAAVVFIANGMKGKIFTMVEKIMNKTQDSAVNSIQ